MSTAQFNTWKSQDGLREYFKCQAWVNFNGTSNTIRASGNVNSITDNGTGDFTINFATALIDANYAAEVSASNGSTSRLTAAATVYAAGSVRVDCNQPTVANQDPAYLNVAIFR